MKITKDMLVGDIIQIHPDAVEILFNFGLSCVGCPASQMESKKSRIFNWKKSN